MIEELDLRILKSITADKVNALTFAYKYDSELFDNDVRPFAKLVVDYVKHFRSPPTLRTLTERHKNNPELTNLINSSWQEIEEFEYDLKEYPYDLAELKKRFKQDAVEKVKEVAASEDIDNLEDPEAFFNRISLEINKITLVELERTYIQIPIGDYIEDFKESYDAYKQNPDSIVEIKTHYSMIDSITGGFAPGELIMVGAETAGGKSMLLNNLGRTLFLQDNNIEMNPSDYLSEGKNVLYFSLEMPYRDCFIRFLASLANVPQKSLLKSTLSFEEEDRVQKAYKFIDEYQKAGYFFDIVDVPRNLTIEEIELRYHDAMLRYRPDIVIVDYMGLMHSTTLAKEQDWLKMGGIAASLHEFGRAYDCVIITAAQLTDLNRGSNSSKDESKRVGVHRWGRSSLIMHHVNSAFQIETRLNEISFPDMRLHAVKNRKGPLAQGTMIKNFANALLIDVPFDENEIPGDISANIPDLIKSIQDAKNKQN